MQSKPFGGFLTRLTSAGRDFVRLNPASTSNPKLIKLDNTLRAVFDEYLSQIDSTDLSKVRSREYCDRWVRTAADALSTGLQEESPGGDQPGMEKAKADAVAFEHVEYLAVLIKMYDLISGALGSTPGFAKRYKEISGNALDKATGEVPYKGMCGERITALAMAKGPGGLPKFTNAFCGVGKSKEGAPTSPTVADYKEVKATEDLFAALECEVPSTKTQTKSHQKEMAKLTRLGVKRHGESGAHTSRLSLHQPRYTHTEGPLCANQDDVDQTDVYGYKSRKPVERYPYYCVGIHKKTDGGKSLAVMKAVEKKRSEMLVAQEEAAAQLIPIVNKFFIPNSGTDLREVAENVDPQALRAACTEVRDIIIRLMIKCDALFKEAVEEIKKLYKLEEFMASASAQRKIQSRAIARASRAQGSYAYGDSAGERRDVERDKAKSFHDARDKVGLVPACPSKHRLQQRQRESRPPGGPNDPDRGSSPRLQHRTPQRYAPHQYAHQEYVHPYPQRQYAHHQYAQQPPYALYPPERSRDDRGSGYGREPRRAAEEWFRSSGGKMR